MLLRRHVIAEPHFVWAAPGGGIKSGETQLAAPRRELWEETGFALGTDPGRWRHPQDSADCHGTEVFPSA